MKIRKLWLRDRKNWEMSNARKLVDFSLAHPDQTMWVRVIPVSVVDLNFNLPS